ncbi:MAG: ATP-binding protein [Planctomycetes bacterium]|nr:ATP-binding protein [Planctomycetota bacterium]MCG2684079.1 ATP-binding protein [Planctomycetales bacterium]
MGQAALFRRRVDSPSWKRGSSERIPADVVLLCRALECIQEGVAISAWPPESDSPLIVHCNSAFTAMLNRFGGGPSGRGRACRAGEPPGDDPLRRSLRESHQSEGIYSAEIAGHGRDGARMLLQLRSVPVRDESERIAHRIAVLRDVTRQALMEESFRRNERLAGIGLLSTGIAHEISNPAGSALLAAETALAIKDSPDASEQFDACLRNIVTSMDRCGRIVRTLLRYSRQEPTEKQACNINDVVAQAMDQARPYGLSNGAELRADLDAEVPLVPMNPLEIELVLLNLIRNAVEAGDEKAAVSIRTMRIKEGVRVAVSDNGRGMNEEQLEHVFDPLYTTRRMSGGSGMGMSIAQGIVQGHEGRMEVRSRPGKGTTVIVDLPIAAGALTG